MALIPAAPWTLKGRGHIIIYRLDKKKASKIGFIPPFLQNKFAGGLAFVMIVDYTQSDIGPYSELLFIPGKFYHRKKKFYHISKIYVSTRDSVAGGRKNWAIPKQLAAFHFQKKRSSLQHIAIHSGNIPISSWTIKTASLPFFVSTRFLPLTLLQRQHGQYYYNRFKGSGWARWAKVQSVDINGRLFPPVQDQKPLAAFTVDPFSLTFLKPVLHNTRGFDP